MTILTRLQINKLYSLRGAKKHLDSDFRGAGITMRHFYIFLSIQALEVAFLRKAMEHYKNNDLRANWVAELILMHDPQVYSIARANNILDRDLATLFAREAVGCESELTQEMLESITKGFTF